MLAVLNFCFQTQNSKAVTSKTTINENDLIQIGCGKVQGAEKTKRAHEASPKEAPAKKRSVFGDITNVFSLISCFFNWLVLISFLTRES